MARRIGTDSKEHARLIERDLTALAAEGRLPAAYGVDAIVSDVLALLAREGKSPLLAGDQGVGKTAVVQEVARRIAKGEAPVELTGVRVVELSVAAILARGERRAAESFDELLEELSQVPGTVVYVRDLALATDSPLVPVMVRGLKAGSLRFLLEADLRRAQQLLRSDEVLAERLHLLVVQEPSPESARWMMARVAEALEAEHGVPVAPAACDQALRLVGKFLRAQRLPRKAIELLRETVAEAASRGREQVLAEDVLARFCASSLLPRFVVDDAAPLDLGEVARHFGERLLGQQDAISAVLRSVALMKAGLNDPNRPLGVFLFAGPSGVGKTHLAKLLAEYLFGSSERLVRLNMADYPDETDDTLPFGAPWAETSVGRRGELARLLDGKVFAVLLLDEFEKAHAKVHDRFLQLFDEGQFVNAAGETVSCNNVLIIATSNVGAEVYSQPPIGFAGTRSRQDLVSEVDRRIAETFRPEFINRFDAVCHFHPLTRAEIRRIAQREVGRVLQRDGIRSRGLDVEVAPEVIDLLVERGYSPSFGARFLQREIEKTLSAALAEEIIRRPLPPGTPVRVHAKPGGRVVAAAEVAPPKEELARLELPSDGAATVKRKLDRRALLSEAERLLRRATQLAARAGRSAIEARRAQLLGRSQAPDFWDDPERAAAVLRDYRVLDAQVSDFDRVAQACQYARRLARDAKGEPHLVAAARAVEDVAHEVRLLELRLAAGDAQVHEALLEICAVGEGEASTAWVRELAGMYEQWARRRGGEVERVAEGSDGSRAPRVVLRVGGAGVLGFLVGESGLHRRVDGPQRVAAAVRALRWPKEGTFAPASAGSVARPVRRRSGMFLEKVGAEVSATDEASGRAFELSGRGDAAELERVVWALMAGEPAPSVEARRYVVGRGAHVEDPRTRVSTPRIKDVLRGELEPFIAAWMSRAQSETPSGVPK